MPAPPAFRRLIQEVSLGYIEVSLNYTDDSVSKEREKRKRKNIALIFLVFCFVETGSSYIVQAGLELIFM